MARQQKRSQYFVVRNRSGQFMGAYLAKSELEAIRHFIHGQAQYNAQFRGGGRVHVGQIIDYTAKVEPKAEDEAR